METQQARPVGGGWARRQAALVDLLAVAASASSPSSTAALYRPERHGRLNRLRFGGRHDGEKRLDVWYGGGSGPNAWAVVVQSPPADDNGETRPTVVYPDLDTARHQLRLLQPHP